MFRPSFDAPVWPGTTVVIAVDHGGSLLLSAPGVGRSWSDAACPIIKGTQGFLLGRNVQIWRICADAAYPIIMENPRFLLDRNVEKNTEHGLSIYVGKTKVSLVLECLNVNEM